MGIGSQFWGATVSGFFQIISDYAGALLRVGGSPFDCGTVVFRPAVMGLAACNRSHREEPASQRTPPTWL